MGVQNLAFVTTLSQPTDSRADDIRRLQLMLREMASSHVIALEQALAQVGKLAAELVEGGDAYPPGIRQLAQRLAEDAPWNVQTLGAIRSRTLRVVKRQDGPAGTLRPASVTEVRTPSLSAPGKTGAATA
jgi:hypothetical protein